MGISFPAIRFSGILSISLAFIIFGITSCMINNDNLEDELDTILEESVPFISPGELNKKMHEKQLVILDIRSDREQEVSMIPGSQGMNYDNFDPAHLKEVSVDDTVVLYCSVGYRSEKAGEILQENGFKHVLNLYGGIFQWKNAGFEVVTPEGEPTDRVHTYNEDWAEYLLTGIKVYD